MKYKGALLFVIELDHYEGEFEIGLDNRTFNAELDYEVTGDLL